MGAGRATGQQPDGRRMGGNSQGEQRQLTTAPHGHILTNAAVWSPDGQWLAYDTRSDPAGDVFDGRTIELVHVDTGEVRTIYRGQHGACCGVATFHPRSDRVAFILGPEHPTPDWQYGAARRQGVIVELDKPGVAVNLDARDLAPPFTPGALRGGTHVHVFSGDGQWVSFTYEDHVLESLDLRGAAGHERNQRNVGVAVAGRAVRPRGTHPRNHPGEYFSVLATRTVDRPTPGSDDICRAVEDAWVGVEGYLRTDGRRQRRALAFQGEVIAPNGQPLREAFIVDLPEGVTVAGDGPLEGTPTTRPAPPRGTVQRRLTYTAGRSFPGLQGARHWLRSSPDGAQIGMLMRDDGGIVQLWTVSPNGGPPRQRTSDCWDVASAFTWSPDGRQVAYIADGSVMTVDVPSGKSTRLTPRGDPRFAPRPEACVWSPDGQRIAFVRPTASDAGIQNQVFVIEV